MTSVARIPTGQADAADAARQLGTILEREGPRLFAIALRMCGNRADAEDMVQDTFLQAIRKWDTFRGESSRGTWLWSIATRSCKVRMRRKGGIDRRMPAMSQVMPWGETTIMAAAAKGAGAGEAAASKESVRRVQGAIVTLPEHYRIPLLLKEVVGLSVEDVSAATGLDPNTIKTRLHRARLALRKVLTSGSRAIEAPMPIYEKQVCLDLLRMKLEAMDRPGSRARSVIPQAEVCARCRAVFRELDFVADACASMGEGEMPRALRDKIAAAIKASDQSAHAAAGVKRPRVGRPPVPRKPSSR